ncbi:glycerate 2-kinase [Devosia enhydra]|uniref:Glycerate 2-kinase n=1 Tax=Devosia enhydra TaxID=665118 RepID=A0A1K2I242_9HYPH|nr:glycerate kinase [Devosia enhydra]SFZ86453.1 glycerate 2-kinase [Devosia enhydra]
MDDARPFLRSLYSQAVERAMPGPAVLAHLPPRPRGRTIVIGAGKASAQMAQALEHAWEGPLNGLVVTRYGYGAPCTRIEIVEAAHPVPDEAGLAAAGRLMQLVSGLGPDDLVIALISGGGSALLPAPGPGMSLADEQAVNRALLASGAPIAAMNAIRNQLSTIKGGRLALAAAPARVVTLVVSDVPGDDPALVASGPTVPITATREEARRLAALYGLDLPQSAANLLAGDANPAPRPDDARLAANSTRVIASAALSLEAAANSSAEAGIAAHILSDAIEGEAREVGRVHAAIAREIQARGRPFTRPAVILSGGETTVTLRGRGKGGRNSEFLLAFALAIDGVEGISAIACDTDGIDGSEDNAGAFADGTSAARIRQVGLDPQALLAGNDAWTAFAAIGDLVVTGPTGTNVNDFRAILVR